MTRMHEPSPIDDRPAPVPPETLTLEGVDPVLRSALEMEAARCGLSVNTFVLHILREWLGLAGPADLCPDLGALAGVWSLEDAEEFAATVMFLEETENQLGTSAGDQPLP